MKKTIIAVASFGGHWIQLLRLAKVLSGKYDIHYISTNESASQMVAESVYYNVKDFNRNNPFKIFSVTWKIFRILRQLKPVAVITTGAAPGLVAVSVAKVLGIKTIWVDSVANAAQLSGSGKIASKFVDFPITQWENVSTKKVKFFGNVFGNLH